MALSRYALYVLDNEKLQELWDLNHENRSLSITKGKLFFQYNPRLCKELIRELAIKGGKNPDEDVHMSPAEDTGPCMYTVHYLCWEMLNLDMWFS